MIRWLLTAALLSVKSKAQLIAENLCLRQHMVPACDRDRVPPRYLIHDRDGSYGVAIARRVGSMGIRQVRTPVIAPEANAVAERWVRTDRAECLDHVFVFGHQQLQRLLNEYVAYYNCWRPYRSLGQAAPDPPSDEPPRLPSGRIVAEAVPGGWHHVCRMAA